MQTTIAHIRLSELNRKIGAALSASLGSMSWWVVADVTNHTFRDHKSYHSFELVEKDPNSNALLARISAKAWGSGSLRIEQFERITGQKFTSNISVLVNVSVEYHPVYGLQADLNDIDPTYTLGALEQQRQAVLERLVRENPDTIKRAGERFITRNNQLRLRSVIQKIAIISSKTSAGAEDFRHTLDNNPHGFKFTIDNYHTVVQGEHNAEQLVDKIIEIFNSGKQYDVVVITRGGGSQTDFLIFDNYYVGRAIARLPIPIITGIGHQKNETIADLMAHTPTKTPTRAAEFIIAHNREYEDSLLGLQQRIVIKSQQTLSGQFRQLAYLNISMMDNVRTILNMRKDQLSEARDLTVNRSKEILLERRRAIVNLTSQLTSRPKIILYNRIQDIRNVVSNLQTFTTQYLRSKRNALTNAEALIRIMKPDNILKRGFAIVKLNDQVISNSSQVKVGSKLDILLSDSTLNVTVNEKASTDGNEANL